MRHARAALSTKCAASRRRRRRIRRWRTIARASTAECSPIACSADCRRETYLAGDHPLQQAIRRAVAHFTATPESELVAGIDGCSAPNYAVPLDRLALGFARLAARHDDDHVRTGAADPCRRHDGAPGNGVRRGAHRSPADARGARRLGGQDRRRRACRGSASAAPASASRSRWRTATSARCGRSSRPFWSSSGWSTRSAAPSLRIGSHRSITNYRGIATGRILPTVVLDKNPVALS